MEFVNKVEHRVAEWYEKAPHLPLGFRQWLGTNVWWLVLIGVILGALAMLNVFFFGTIAALFAVMLGGPVGAAIVGVAVIVSLLVFAGAIIELVIGALAIRPLKDRQKKGWSLLLLALLVSAGFAALTFLFSFDLSSLVMSALWLAVSGYFLFEIRDQFAGVATVKAAKVSAVSTKSTGAKTKTSTKK
jgi:uncharacterized membrane protein YhaH (DUF805 family)